jgi:hypothetical protein
MLLQVIIWLRIRCVLLGRMGGETREVYSIVAVKDLSIRVHFGNYQMFWREGGFI